MKGGKKIFDPIRKKWSDATPEECVRQHWLKVLTEHLHYPKDWLVVEKQLSQLPHLAFSAVPDRRLDILCYAKRENEDALFPLLLMECKKETTLADSAMHQVIGYNHYVNAIFVAIVNLTDAKLGYFDKTMNTYQFCSFLPPFKELMQWVRQSVKTF